MSPRDIHAIIKEEEAGRQKHKDQELSSKANKLFSKGKTTVEVANILNLPATKVSKLYREYWHLKGLHKLNTIYKETNGKLWTFLKLYTELIKKRRMSIEQVANIVDTAIHKLPHMESLYKQAKDEAEKMQHTVQRLANDIEARKHKILALDKTAFSIELDCRRTQQRVQELGDKKDRLEKLIGNILNGEGYSKLKQIVKEIVKAVLSEKRVLISISFAAVIQTLKDNPEKFHLIYNTHTTANKSRHVNDNTNAIKYAEFDRDSLLDLVERNYENLAEALTNNCISSAAASSNPTLSSPQSSSTLPNLSNQNDTYKIDDNPESFHNNKGDIVD